MKNKTKTTTTNSYFEELEKLSGGLRRRENIAFLDQKFVSPLEG
jgi:hypothetical protein